MLNRRTVLLAPFLALIPVERDHPYRTFNKWRIVSTRPWTYVAAPGEGLPIQAKGEIELFWRMMKEEFALETATQSDEYATEMVATFKPPLGYDL